MKKLVGEGKPFHSAVDKTAALLKRKVGTGAEFMKELMGVSGIKPTEIQERGLNEIMGMPRMTHDQFMANLATRPAPAIGEKVLGEGPNPRDVIRAANAHARDSASNYAESADTSRESRQMRVDELRRLRENHRPQMMEFARRELEDTNLPHHEKWTLPGGENYREMLIKAPEQPNYMEQIDSAHNELRNMPYFDRTPAQEERVGQLARLMREIEAKAKKLPEQFPGVGGHFGGEPGILASMRLKDRTGPNGEKLLHLEELQSDWHQQGREHGYKEPGLDEKLKAMLAQYNQLYEQRSNLLRAAKNTPDTQMDVFTKMMDQAKEMSSQLTDMTEKMDKVRSTVESGIPDAPFKKNWEEMALKRLIHHAAEKGYHGVVVTPGVEQAKRYNIGNHIGYLGYHPEEERLKAYGHDRREVMNQTGIKKEDLPNHIGKEVADRLLKAPQMLGTHQLEGEDIHVGGEGMKGFYDKKVPNILNSIGKKYGVKTELNAHPVESLLKNKVADLHHFPITEEMRKDVLTNGLPLYNQGGKVHMAKGGDMDQMQLELMKNQFNLHKAADRAQAGKLAAELIKGQPEMKASEALGQIREKGIKRVSTTQADRTRVGGGNIGGAAFSALSAAHPAYAGKVWGVGEPTTAARLTNLSSPETAWTTMLGSATQLKTNPIVFDKLKRQFLAAMKAGMLSPELEAKINHNLALTFGEGASIRDPKVWKQADTFDKRAALADLMMGQGIAPGKGGVALGGEKSGQGVIFKPSATLMQETEPGLHHPEHGGNVPTFAVGPRLFTLNKDFSYRPDLHPGFPVMLHGEDLGKRMRPVPTETFLPDWHKAFKKSAGGRKPGYYDLALGMRGQGLPSQEITDAYIRHLMTEGHKKGGRIKKANGGPVDIKNVGVEEAPDMDVKAYFPPYPARGNNLPVGGVQQPPQAPQDQQQSMQAPQGMPPQGGPTPQQPPSNILQMTPQGQAMSAIKPPQMKRGGSTKRVAYNHNKDTMMLELMDAKRYSKRK